MGSSEYWWSGQERGWRYLAFRLDGTGVQGASLDNELPLRDVSMTDVDSGPPQLTGTISPVFKRLIAPDGDPILREWGTAIFAESNGVIRGGGILVNSSFTGPDWRLEVSGFSSYLRGMGYEAVSSFTETDALDLVRHVWDHVQSGERSNLGLVLDRTTTTGMLVGKATPVPVTAEDGSVIADPSAYYGTASQDQQPFTLNPWETDDLGDVVDQLARDTPFGYHERHQWNVDKTIVEHYLDFGSPSIGTRRNLRFVLGENVFTAPEMARDGSRYANHVRVLGAGEGSATVRAEARAQDGRLRRMVTVDDDGLEDGTRAQLAARSELARRSILGTISRVAVLDTPQTPLGSWQAGDEIRIQGELDWVEFDLWFRVTALTITPDSPEVITMDVVRIDSIAR